MNKKILNIAIPSIVSNITVPLLGLIDVAIVGHLGSASYIGAIAVGGMLFNMIYWIFGFLRMGTSGMTSQAYGRRNMEEVISLLVRSLGVASFISVVLLLLQYPLLKIAFGLIRPTEEVAVYASSYFHICVWGAPAVLGLYGLSGWFIGMQNSRFPMFVAITQNIINIIASLFFVYGLDMKVEGVAFGTLTAQYGGFLMAIFLWYKYYGRLGRYFDNRICWGKDKMYAFFRLNRDIFFRTLCLVAVTTFFTSAGARQGDVILAVNTLLMQFFTLFSYVMDGFAYSGEALSGLYIGSGNKVLLNKMIKNLFYWGIGMALLFTCLYAIGGKTFVSLLTDEKEVITASMEYLPWIIVVPIAGFSAFLWDGIFIGATASKYMLIAMFVASVCFFLIYNVCYTKYENHALWLAFIVYLSARGVVQTICRKRALATIVPV